MGAFKNSYKIYIRALLVKNSAHFYYHAGGVSGGHINPAVTLAMAVVGKFPWKKVLYYMVAQYLGAIAASALVFAIYYEALEDFEAKTGTNLTRVTPDTAGIWATYPSAFLSHYSGMLDQVKQKQDVLF